MNAGFLVLSPLRLLAICGHFKAHTYEPDGETEVVATTERGLGSLWDRVDKVYGKRGDGDPSGLHHPSTKELGRTLLDLIETAVTTRLLDALKEKAAKSDCPEEGEAGHDSLPGVESRKRSGERDGFEAVKIACSNPWHVERGGGSRDEAERATQIVILFGLERDGDACTCCLEAVDQPERWKESPETHCVGAHCEKLGVDVRRGKERTQKERWIRSCQSYTEYRLVNTPYDVLRTKRSGCAVYVRQAYFRGSQDRMRKAADSLTTIGLRSSRLADPQASVLGLAVRNSCSLSIQENSDINTRDSRDPRLRLAPNVEVQTKIRGKHRNTKRNIDDTSLTAHDSRLEGE